MIEALRTLSSITDYSDDELTSLDETFGRECLLHQLSVPVAAVIDARKELAKAKDPGDSAVSAATIIACAEVLVDAIDVPSLQGASDIPGAPAAFLALRRAIDNMRKHRSK